MNLYSTSVKPDYKSRPARAPGITITLGALEEMLNRVQNPKPQYIGLHQKKEVISPIGIRVKVDNKGCSGNKYVVEYAYRKNVNDEEWEFLVQNQLLKVLVDPITLLRIIGCEIDYETDLLKQEFIFKNPNEKGRCGCGQSFY